MMPSLSARRDEIAVIALALKDVVAEKLDVPVRDLDATALARLASLPMPENLVSLEAVLANAQLEVSPLKAINAAAIARADALSSSGNLHDVWNGKLQSMAEAAIETDGFELEQLNQLFYQLAIDRADGNVAKAAQLLGLTRPQLAYRLRGREA